jgi:hypothetical protein
MTVLKNVMNWRPSSRTQAVGFTLGVISYALWLPGICLDLYSMKSPFAESVETSLGTIRDVQDSDKIFHVLFFKLSECFGTKINDSRRLR